MSVTGPMIGTSAAGRQFPEQQPAPHSGGGVSSGEWLAIGLLVLLGFALRFEGLAAQSLWADEGNSWGMTVRPLSAIAAAAAGDIHPPLYYYLLNLWCRVFGRSEAGLRSLSALLGLALVLVTYLWARYLAGKGVALAAGLVAAISPFAICYSQEARAYILVALLAAASSYCLAAYLVAVARAQRRLLPGAAYVLLALALLWSHYLGFLVLLLQNLLVAIWLMRQRPAARRMRQGLSWLGMQALVLLGYSPWLAVVIRQAGAWPAISQKQPLGFYLNDMVRLYTLGPSSDGMSRIAWLALLPVLAGLALGWKRSRAPLLWAFVVIFAIWPALAMWALSLLRGAYRAKFLLMGLPGFHILLAAGAIWFGRAVAQLLPRRLRLPAAGVVAAVLLLPLGAASAQGWLNYRYEPRYWRDDYRAAARFIEAAAGSHSAVILDAPGQSEVFSYYYHGAAGVYPLPRQRPPDEAALKRELSALAANHERVFALLWATDESDPQRIVETWLDQNAYKGIDAWYGNIRLVSYELPGPLQAQPTEARFGDSIRLLAYARADHAVEPGQALPVELQWLCTQAVTARYKVFLQVLDADSNIVGQRDSEPAAGAKPTDAWQAGEQVLDREAVPILLGTPPGKYSLIAGLYDASTGARLRLPDGSDHLFLGQVEVAPAPRFVADEALRLASPTHISLGPLRLLGWQTSLPGHQPSPQLSLAPGEPLSLVLYWRVQAQKPLHLRISLEAKGNSRLLSEGEAMQGRLAPTMWSPEELLREPRMIFLPSDVKPGRYILTLQVESEQGSGRVDLAEVRVRAGSG